MALIKMVASLEGMGEGQFSSSLKYGLVRWGITGFFLTILFQQNVQWFEI